jgi:hypothetical protein
MADGVYTQASLAALFGPDEKVYKRVFEKMSTSGAWNDDAKWTQSNMFSENMTSRPISLPSPEARMGNRGISPGRGVSANVIDKIGYYESMSMVDDFQLKGLPSGQAMTARLKGDVAHAVGIAQQGRTKDFYSDPTEGVNEYASLSYRRNKLGTYCLDGTDTAGQTKYTSLYFTAWDPNQGLHKIYPEGSKGGLDITQYPLLIIPDPNYTDKARYLPVWISWFCYYHGLVLEEEQYLVRIANINPDSEVADYMKNIFFLMQRAFRLMELTADGGNVRIYGNIDCLSFIDRLQTIANVNLDPVTIEGKTFFKSFNKAPLRQVNEISSSEDVVSL